MQQRILLGLWLLCAGCAARRPVGAAQQHAAAPTDSLSSSSRIACQRDDQCAVCYRADTCGEPLAAGDPSLATPLCHVPPRAFCLARRAHCDEGHCVAR